MYVCINISADLDNVFRSIASTDRFNGNYIETAE